ncbi:hypothetical protein D3C71_1019610 [compost metagenome]
MVIKNVTLCLVQQNRAELIFGCQITNVCCVCYETACCTSRCVPWVTNAIRVCDATQSHCRWRNHDFKAVNVRAETPWVVNTNVRVECCDTVFAVADSTGEFNGSPLCDLCCRRTQTNRSVTNNESNFLLIGVQGNHFIDKFWVTRSCDQVEVDGLCTNVFVAVDCACEGTNNDCTLRLTTHVWRTISSIATYCDPTTNVYDWIECRETNIVIVEREVSAFELTGEVVWTPFLDVVCAVTCVEQKCAFWVQTWIRSIWIQEVRSQHACSICWTRTKTICSCTRISKYDTEWCCGICVIDENPITSCCFVTIQLRIVFCIRCVDPQIIVS